MGEGVSIRTRIEKIEEEIEGVASQYGVTSWERARMEEWKDRAFLSEKQEAILEQIEEKVFGEE